MKRIFENDQDQLRNGWKILAFVALCGASMAAMIAMRRLLPADVRPFVPEPWLAAAGALLASWICLRAEGAPLTSIGLQLDARAARLFLAGLAGGMGLLLATAGGVWLCGGFHLEASGGAALGGILKSGVMMSGAALFEELLFRGYAFQRGIRGMGQTRALLVFGVVFTAVHNLGEAGSVLVAGLAATNILLAALLLGLCYLRSGGLALPFGVHLGWNWMMESLGFAVSGNQAVGSWFKPVFDSQSAWLTGGAFGLEASAVSIVVLVMAVAALAYNRGFPNPRAAL